MKIRKLISVLLTVSLILALSSAVFADNGISGENSIVVSYNTAQNYEIIIRSPDD